MNAGVFSQIARRRVGASGPSIFEVALVALVTVTCSGAGETQAGGAPPASTSAGADTSDASSSTTSPSGVVPTTATSTSSAAPTTLASVSSEPTVDEPSAESHNAPAHLDAGSDGGDGGIDAGADPQPGVLPVVHFEPSGRGFETSLGVTLTSNVARPIHYTLDGSLPDGNSPSYDGPLMLESTAVVRTYVEGLETPASYAAQSYVRLGVDVASFTSDLPVVLIDLHRGAPLDAFSKEFQPSSVLVFEPGADGRTRLLGPAATSYRSGVRVRGAFSRYFPQLSYAFETWQAGADQDEAVPLFGMPAESDWVLSAPSEMDRALFRNKFVMDLSRKLGRYAPRAQFVEVFLANDPASEMVTLRDYVGVYTAMEKIKRDAGRVAVSKLSATDLEGPALTGGYIFRIDHDENDFSAGGYDFGWVYPDAEEMALGGRGPQLDYLTGYLGEFFASLEAPGFVNPTTNKHYSEYIDVQSWIDHNLLTTLTKNVDGLRLSAYFYKDRGGLLGAGPAWDFDRSLGTPHDGRAQVAAEWASGDGTDPRAWGYWSDLFRDPQFVEDYWQRWDELRLDVFSAGALLAMVDDYESQLLEARERHFERWPELPPEGGADGEVMTVRSWITERLTFLDEERQISVQ